MATTPGQRFVRRQNAARSSTSNTAAADIGYDTAVISEGGYTWSSPEVTVDEAGYYLNLFDIGLCDLGSTRAVGTLVPAVNTVQQAVFRATHRYLRNSGNSQDGCSFGAALLDLSVNDDVKVRNPGALTPTDAVNNYATGAGEGGGLQMIRLPAGDLTDVRRTVDAAEVGTSNINTTRPWLDSSGTWTKVTYNSEVSDDGAWYSGTGGDVVLPANSKFLIVWGVTAYSTDASRHTYVSRLQIDGTNVQSASAYQRNTASQGPPMVGVYLHETGGTSETANLWATHEIEGGDAGTPQVSDAYMQVLALPSSAEWIHVDNGATDSLTTALAGTTTWYDTPLSSTLRADGNSDLSLDAANDAVQNDSGGTLPVLAIGWQRWDRDSGSSGTRKAPMLRFNNGGAAVQYGNNSAFSRGQQSNDDTFQAHVVSAATFDLANAADAKLQVTDRASGSNSDMGVYASTSRHFLGVQVLNLNTLDAAPGGEDNVAEGVTGSLSLSGQVGQSQTTEANTAAGVTGTLTLSGLVGQSQVTEANTAQGVTGSLSLAGQLGQSQTSEGDTAVGVTGALTLTGNAGTSQTTENNVAAGTAGALALTGTPGESQATEANTAAGVTGSLALTGQPGVSQTSAGNTAQGVTGALALTSTLGLSQATENRTAEGVTSALTLVGLVGQSQTTEGNVALGVAASLALSGLLGESQTTETNVAAGVLGALTLTGQPGVSQVPEDNIAEGVTGTMSLTGLPGYALTTVKHAGTFRSTFSLSYD